MNERVDLREPPSKHFLNVTNLNEPPREEEEEEFIFRTKPNTKMNKHINKVRKATGRAKAI